MNEINAITAIAFRDLVKFLRDPARLMATFIFPLIFIAALGGSMQASLGQDVGYNFLTFTFTGVFVQTLFQSSALGLISLIEDRENDFSQEIFVSPISRYSIVFGKIVGESLVAMAQGVGILLFGFLIGISISTTQFLSLGPIAIASCLLGGAFGVLVLSNLPNRRAAEQVFPFLLLPQFFLAGVFAPIQNLPLYLEVLSRISPLRYAVDLGRGLFYAGMPEYPKVVLAGPAFNSVVIVAMFMVFLVTGTILFVRHERNR